jgi:Ca-activated chloride channel family protein
MSYPIEDEGKRFNQASSDFKFAASVAMFGMKLRDSAHDASTNFDEIMELASSNLGEKPSSYRTEFVELVARAKGMK